MPDIDTAIHQPYADQGVIVRGVYSPSEDPTLIEDFRTQTGVTFPLVRDERNSLSQLAFPPGVGFPYPRDVVIGKDGTIRAIRNSFNVEEMDALVQELLAE